MPKKRSFSDPDARLEAKRYSNPIVSRKAIQNLLADIGEPIKIKRIAKLAGLTEKSQLDALKKRLRAMCQDGQLMVDRQGSYGLVDRFNLLHCKVQGHKDGYGFAVPEDKSDDLYLNNGQMRTVFDGDEVLVKISNIDRRGRREGEIVEVLKRANPSLVGRYLEEGAIGYFLPDNSRIKNEILISPEQRAGAKEGEIVQVEILDYPVDRFSAQGRVIEILGEYLDPGLEIEVAIRSHDIPSTWCEGVLSEADNFKLPDETEIERRLDFRAFDFVTIDGEDARDFDDAVYCEKKDGGWRLLVAIADVSHYVRPNTRVDEEALRRGNSVYFPNRVVSMLPEILSNKLCSLVPLEDRLVLVCDMSISDQGKINDFVFCEGVIQSKARLTYSQVKEVIDGHRKLKINSKIQTNLHKLYELYKILLISRSRRGAIDFDTLETQIIFDDFRKIQNIVPAERNEAHKLIEECMLCANISAARFLETAAMPALYRVHERPGTEKLANLRIFLGELGLDLKGGQQPSPVDYQRILDQARDRKDFSVIQTMLLRSLTQAVYQPENKGHFGLHYPTYTHFTSPIRRYPDLLVHRAIRAILRGQEITDAGKPSLSIESSRVAENIYPYDVQRLIMLGEHCSMAERRAEDATREVQLWLKCEYLSSHVGDRYAGVVSGVTNFGLFIELDNLCVDGLLHVTSLPKDYYAYDPARQRLSGQRSGRDFGLGDPLDVIVARVDLEDKKIDLELSGGRNKGKKRNNKSKRSKKKVVV